MKQRELLTAIYNAAWKIEGWAKLMTDLADIVKETWTQPDQDVEIRDVLHVVYHGDSVKCCEVRRFYTVVADILDDIYITHAERVLNKQKDQASQPIATAVDAASIDREGEQDTTEGGIDESACLDIDSLDGTKLEDMTLPERLDLAECLMEECATLTDAKSAEEVLFALKKCQPKALFYCEYNDILEGIAGMTHTPTAQQAINYVVSYVLFCVIMRGHKPAECWSEDADKQYAKIIDVCYKLTLDYLGYDYSGQADQLGYLVNELRWGAKEKYISALRDIEEDVRFINLYERFWDVFVEETCIFSASIYLKFIREIKNKKYEVRQGTENKYEDDRLFAYTISYRGQKQGHTVCDDYVLFKQYDGADAWLAVCCDGVGSRIYSSKGAFCAAQALDRVIGGRLSDRAKHDWHREQDCEDWMTFLRYGLADALYQAWEEEIKQCEEYKECDQKIVEFATTLQFAFGYRGMIACGRLGDGTLFVRKVENNAEESVDGGFLLNDGISGVTRHTVLALPSLKVHPTALQVDFFAADEVTDIVIGTDGVSGCMYDNTSVARIIKLVKELDAMPADARCAKLSNMAMVSSDVTQMRYGRGDDASIVFVHLKKS